MSLNALLQDIDDWCGTPLPGHPPRPPWLRDILTAVVLAEMSTGVATETQRNDLYETARDLYRSAAEQVALNPQPLPPLREPASETWLSSPAGSAAAVSARPRSFLPVNTSPTGSRCSAPGPHSTST